MKSRFSFGLMIAFALSPRRLRACAIPCRHLSVPRQYEFDSRDDHLHTGFGFT